MHVSEHTAGWIPIARGPLSAPSQARPAMPPVYACAEADVLPDTPVDDPGLLGDIGQASVHPH